MRIGLDVAQTCLERHGRGWIADRVATAIGNICRGDDVILYHQFGDWLNWDTSRGTTIGQSNVSAPFLGSSWCSARIAWKRIEAGSSNLPGDPEVVHSFSFQAPNTGNARLVYTVYDLSFWTHPQFASENDRLNSQRGMLDAIRAASALAFISENARNDFSTLFPLPNRVRMLPTVVFPLASRFPGVPISRSEFLPGPWLSIGAMEPRKNFELLLDAFEIYEKDRIAGESFVWPEERDGKVKPPGDASRTFNDAPSWSIAAIYQTTNSSDSTEQRLGLFSRASMKALAFPFLNP